LHDHQTQHIPRLRAERQANADLVLRLRNCVGHPGSLYGNERKSTAMTTLKIAEFNPMPTASVDDHYYCKPRLLEQYSQAVPQILPECMHKCSISFAKRTT
jgi:hypothetical protein